MTSTTRTPARGPSAELIATPLTGAVARWWRRQVRALLGAPNRCPRPCTAAPDGFGPRLKEESGTARMALLREAAPPPRRWTEGRSAAGRRAAGRCAVDRQHPGLLRR